MTIACLIENLVAATFEQNGLGDLFVPYNSKLFYQGLVTS